jgi:hypothetical protein
MTNQLEPTSVLVDKLFKDYLREEYGVRLLSENRPPVPSAKIKGHLFQNLQN